MRLPATYASVTQCQSCKRMGRFDREGRCRRCAWNLRNPHTKTKHPCALCTAACFARFTHCWRCRLAGADQEEVKSG